MRLFILACFIISNAHGACISETCVYGHCVNGTCICDPGVYGQMCNKDIIDCDADSCLNNGTCIELVNGFACQCLPDFDGSRCQHRRTKHGDRCKKECRHNGKCIVINNTEQCSCTSKYHGSECEHRRTNDSNLSAIRKCSLLKFRNSHNEATCLAIGLTPLFDVHCQCHHDIENKNVAICQLTPSPYSTQKCSFKKVISLSPLSTLPDPISIHVCPVNWQILEQYENTQEKVNSVHVTRCQLYSS